MNFRPSPVASASAPRRGNMGDAIRTAQGRGLLQPPVLVLELLQPLRVAHVHPTVLLLPGVERVSADADLPAHLVDVAGLTQLQRRDDLLLGEPALPHVSSSLLRQAEESRFSAPPTLQPGFQMTP